jgi:catechol 2,3-dioxygenase-like lactoylglutathione lyase family enzyme
MMGLHRLSSITVGVPDVAACAAFYRDFGLTELRPGALATRDGGEQLRLVPAPRRRLLELAVGVASPDDVERIARSLGAIGLEPQRDGAGLSVRDPASGVRVAVAVEPPLEQAPPAAVRINAPGLVTRRNERADSLGRSAPVAPRKLGHVVIGCRDAAASRRFFVDGIGFKVSDEIEGVASFLRCSQDHHNVLVQASPVAFLHHTAWQVDDVDEVGRGAQAMIAADPRRHCWGLGRHFLGSNYFWYLRDPAGAFAEYYSDLDVIDDDAAWRPEAATGMNGLFAWGPPVPPEFLMPADLGEGGA